MAGCRSCRSPLSIGFIQLCFSSIPWAPRENGNKNVYLWLLSQWPRGTTACPLLHPQRSGRNKVRPGRLPVADSEVRTFWSATKCCCTNKRRMTVLQNEYNILSYYHYSWDLVFVSSPSWLESDSGLTFPLPSWSIICKHLAQCVLSSWPQPLFGTQLLDRWGKCGTWE